VGNGNNTLTRTSGGGSVASQFEPTHYTMSISRIRGHVTQHFFVSASYLAAKCPSGCVFDMEISHLQRISIAKGQPACNGCCPDSDALNSLQR
jgi:hypothetical protein